MLKNDKQFKVTKGLKLKQSFVDKSKHTMVFHFQDIADKINCELILQPFLKSDDNPAMDYNDGWHLILEMEKNKETTILRDPSRDFEERYEKYKNELLDTIKYKNQNK